MQKYDADVIVIGAGPAGSTVSAGIARKGYSVFLAEKCASPGQASVCGGGIDKTSVEHLKLPARVIEKDIERSMYHFPGKIYSLPTPSLSVQRDVFDRYLAEEAERCGAKLLVSTMAQDVTLKKSEMIVSLRNLAQNESYDVKTKIAIFADGPNTLSSKKFADVGFVKKPHNTALAAIYEIQWKNNPYDCFEYFFDSTLLPWGYGWIFPKKNLLNVGVMSLTSKMRANIRTVLDFFVEKHPMSSRKLRGRRKLRFAVDIIPLEQARKSYMDRALVVGDAAGMVDPLWGGGIGYAIRGSSIAARVATEALEKGGFDESFLSLFEKKWKKDRYFQHLRRQRLLSRIFMLYSRFDKRAYVRLQKLFMIKERAATLPSSEIELAA